MTLIDAEIEKEYIISEIRSNDDELVKFLFTLGCYQGEKITVVNKKKHNVVISVKDARYSIDNDLASCIVL